MTLNSVEGKSIVRVFCVNVDPNSSHIPYELHIVGLNIRSYINLSIMRRIHIISKKLPKLFPNRLGVYYVVFISQSRIGIAMAKTLQMRDIP